MDSLSIVVCTFNGRPFIEVQMASLLAQGGAQEIIAVDDGSTDGTVEVLRDCAARDARVQVHVNPLRLGVAGNFERAIGLAHGTWVALADQDDVWQPEKLAVLRRAWDGRAGLVHHATHKFRGEPPAVLPQPAGQGRKFHGHDVRRLLYRNSVVGHTIVMRRDLALRLMPFPADLPHDWWIAAGAAILGDVQYVDAFLVFYRIHARNTYHRAGSRLERLRAEHALRLRLLRQLEPLPALPRAARRFIRAYRDRLQAAESRRWARPLWRFYWRHAGLFFGDGGTRLPWITRARKSFGAVCAAVTQPARAPLPAAVWPEWGAIREQEYPGQPSPALVPTVVDPLR